MAEDAGSYAWSSEPGALCAAYEVEFATKTTLAREMLGRALDAGVPASFVTADEAYGQDYEFRSWCEQRRIGHVVAVPRSQTIPLSTDGDLA